LAGTEGAASAAPFSSLASFEELPQGLKPAFLSAIIGATEQLAEEVLTASDFRKACLRG
jgi:hypothetical protein